MYKRILAIIALFAGLVLIVGEFSRPPDVRGQVTATSLVNFPLVNRQAGDGRPVGWSSPYVMYQNINGKLAKAVLVDTTELDALTNKFERRWAFDLVSKTAQTNPSIIACKFNITRYGVGANSTRDTTLILNKYQRVYSGDFDSGLDIWWWPTDSMSTGDDLSIYFMHTSFVQFDAFGHQKVLTTW